MLFGGCRGLGGVLGYVFGRVERLDDVLMFRHSVLRRVSPFRGTPLEMCPWVPR